MKPCKLLLLICFLLLAASASKAGDLEDFCLTLSRNPDRSTLTIFHLSDTVSTRAALRPGDVQRWYSPDTNKFSGVSKFTDSNPRNVKEFLEHAQGQASQNIDGHGVDCRWAFIVSDASGHEKLVIYVDAFLSKALANGKQFTPDASFCEWINKKIRPTLDLDEQERDKQWEQHRREERDKRWEQRPGEN